jgi:hypothetical protein
MAPPEPPRKSFWRRNRVPVIVIGLIVVLIGGCVAAIGGAADETSTADDPPATEAPATTPAPTEAPPAAEAPPATEPPTTEAPPTTDSDISRGAGSRDASADVGVPVMDPPDVIGVSYVHVPVTNNSSGRSDYFIELAIESADGATQYETTFATLSSVEPGQSASAEGMVAWGSAGAPADATVRTTTVQRTASF